MCLAAMTLCVSLQSGLTDITGYVENFSRIG